MNVKKERKPGVCAAMRCTAAPESTVPGICFEENGVPEDERVELCGRHEAQATKEFGLDEVPGAVRPISGEVSADDFEAALHEGAELRHPLAGTMGDAEGVEDAALEEAEDGAEGNVLDELPPEGLALVEEATGESPLGMPAAELAQETEEAEGLLAHAREMEIETQEDLEFAAEVLKETKGRKKKLEERLKQITAPLRAAEKSVRDLFRPPLDFYGTLESELKGRIAEVKLRQDEANRAAMLEAAEAHAAGDGSATEAALARVTTLANVKGVGTRETWDFELLDASLLPREFLMPDLRALADHAKAAPKDDAPAPVPGVRFFPKVVVSARSS